MRSLYAIVMRSLEVHVLETATDIGGALSAGTVSPEQVIETTCSDCGEDVGYLDGMVDFIAFCVVIDENNRDWIVCLDCSASIVDGDWRQATTSPERYAGVDEDIEYY